MMNRNDEHDIVERGVRDIEDSHNNTMHTDNDNDDKEHGEPENKSPPTSVILIPEGSNTASSNFQRSVSILGTTTNSNKIGEASVNSNDDIDYDNNDDSFSKEEWNSQQSTKEGDDYPSRDQSNKQEMTLAAKREYNRMNAARARKRAKTQLYTYQKQIQELDVEICTLREVNTSLKATLQSLQQENMRLIQNLDDVKKERHSQNTATAYASIPIQNQQPPSFLDRSATYTLSPAVNSTNTTSLQDTLMQIYLAGVAVQKQQQSSASPQPNQTSTPQQLQPQPPDSSSISMTSNMNWPLLQPPTTTILNQQSNHSQQPQQLCYANPNLSFLSNNVDASQLGQNLMTALLSMTATSTNSSNNTNMNTTGTSTYTNDATSGTSNQ